MKMSEDDSAVPLAKTAPKSGPSVPVSVQTKDDVYEAFIIQTPDLSRATSLSYQGTTAKAHTQVYFLNPDLISCSSRVTLL